MAYIKTFKGDGGNCMELATEEAQDFLDAHDVKVTHMHTTHHRVERYDDVFTITIIYEYP